MYQMISVYAHKKEGSYHILDTSCTRLMTKGQINELAFLSLKIYADPYCPPFREFSYQIGAKEAIIRIEYVREEAMSYISVKKPPFNTYHNFLVIDLTRIEIMA